MKGVILTEAGQKVGFGHLSRCSAVYHAFVRRGVNPLMIINGDAGVSGYLKGVKHELVDWLTDFQELLSRIAGADIVFIDSYLADEAKYRDIASTVGLIACVDDYNRIRYPQGMVINGLIYAPQVNYPRMKGVHYLLGTRYAFLRKAFWNVPGKKISPVVKNIFMTFGGSDFFNLAPGILREVIDQYPDEIKTIVVSRFYENVDEIKSVADKRTKVIVDATDEQMKKLMMTADVAVSASGQTLSELASLGVPGVAICVADNQRLNWKAWGARGFAAVQPKPEAVIRGLKKLESSSIRRKMSLRLRRSISGQGTFAVVDALLKKAKALKIGRKRCARRFTIRKADKSDCRDIWLWRNTQHARSASFQSEPIPYERHEQWFFRKINDRRSVLWLAHSGGEKVGYVRHDIDGDKAVNSVLLNPQFYGMGLGAAVIRKADEAYRRINGMPKVICAEIQDHHAASIKAFGSAGYRFAQKIVKNGKRAGVYQFRG